MNERMMPVQGMRLSNSNVRPIVDQPRGQVPESVARLAFKTYAEKYDQDFETLHSRGGFSWSELIDCLRGDYTHGTSAEEMRKAHNDDSSR